MTSKEFCKAAADIDWIFDFFALGYDYLLTYPPQSTKFPDKDVVSAIKDAEKQGLTDAVATADGSIPELMYSFLNISKDTLLRGVAESVIAEDSFWYRLAACLRSIDRAVESLSPFTFGHGRLAWKRVHKHCVENGWRLDLAGPRQVRFKPPALASQPWFRYAESQGLKETETRGQFHQRFYQNLSRIIEHPDCEIAVYVPDALQDLAAPWKGPLRIAICPITNELKVGKTEAVLTPGEFRIVVDHAKSSFSVLDDRANQAALKSIIEDALVGAVSGLTDILLFPELTIPDFLLEHLQQRLRQMKTGGLPTPALVLAGSWVRTYAGQRFNEAVLLNDRGQVLLRQHKLQLYGMQGYEQDKYGLKDLFGGASTIQEDADVTPRIFCVVDSRSAGLRLAILTCEDLCEPFPGAALARDLSVSVVFSPVMAGPLSTECGFYINSGQLAANPGSLICVANSGALARERWRRESKPGEPPLGLVAAPLYGTNFRGISQLAATGPSQLITFSLP